MLVRVRIGVLANTRQAEILDPPDRVLDQVVGEQRVALVEVGHRVREPAVGVGGLVVFRRVRVLVRRAGVRRLGTRFRDVDPGSRRQVGHPPVIAAGVVGDHVHDDADALVAGLVDEGGVALVTAETRIDLVEVRRCVAVIRAFLHRVLEYGIQPDLRESQVGDVIEVPAHALEIAAVASVVVTAVGFVGVALDAVVAGIAVGEAVGRNQVDDVAGVIGADATRRAFAQFVGPGYAVVSVRKHEVERSRHGRPAELEVHEQVVRAVAAHHAGDADSRRIDGRLVTGDVVAPDQQLQFRMGETRPPERRFDTPDAVSGDRRGIVGSAGRERREHGRAEDVSDHRFPSLLLRILHIRRPSRG